MASKTLRASAITFLRRRGRLVPVFSFDFHPDPKSSATSSNFCYLPGYFSYPTYFSARSWDSGKTFSPERSRTNFLPSSWESGRNICSESAEKGAGKCWNCGAVSSSTPFLACQCCKTVQPVDKSVDYFQIFGVEKCYEIRDENLETKYKDWQKKLHPDLVHSKSEKEKKYAAEQSARVIEAYHTLSKPLPRALYLLKLEGVHVDEEMTLSDPELLAEIMDIREAVEEANDGQALKQIQSQIHAKLEKWCETFGNAFKNCNFGDAITSIQRMTYYQRAIEEIVKKL